MFFFLSVSYLKHIKYTRVCPFYIFMYISNLYVMLSHIIEVWFLACEKNKGADRPAYSDQRVVPLV